MRVFCDTSVLVAASLRTHVRHAAARATLLRIRSGDDTGYAFAHALAETFSVLSRMPTRPKLEPGDVFDMLERNVIPHFAFVALQAESYTQAIRDIVAQGLGGGRIYDLLHLRAASTLELDRIYTFNEVEWRKLAPALAPLICAPPPVARTPSAD